MVSFTCLENEEVQTLTKFDEHLKNASEICSDIRIALSKHATLEESIKVMTFWNYHQTLVMDWPLCLGLITESSILKFQLEHGRNSISKAKSIEAMEDPPQMIDWNQPITRDVLELLYDVKCLLVNKNEKIIGIITPMDALKEQKN